jgi:Zn-finger nucleic acid-binding protein
MSETEFLVEIKAGNDESVEIHRCPRCHGLLGIDSTYLDQVDTTVICPMCTKEICFSDPSEVEEEQEEEIVDKGFGRFSAEELQAGCDRMHMMKDEGRI